MANEYYLTVAYDENVTFSNGSFKETCESLSQETLDYLHDLNHEVTLNTIPLQLYYVILIVIGIIGNILVIYIYGRKLQKVCKVHHYRPQSRSLSRGVSVGVVYVQGVPVGMVFVQGGLCPPDGKKRAVSILLE